MSKDCKECKHYKEDRYGYGKCVYPVPAWISLSPFVNGYEADSCLTYEVKHENQESKKNT